MTARVVPLFEAEPPREHDPARRWAWLLGIVAAGMLPVVLPPVQAGVVIACLAGMWLAASRPTWALALILLAVPLEFLVLDLGVIGLSVVQIVVLFVVALMIAEMFAVGRLQTPRTPLDVPIFLWLAVGFFGAIGAEDPAATIKKAGLTLVLAALFYLVVAKVRRLGTVSTLMAALVAGCSAAGAYGVWVSYRYLAEGVVTGSTLVVGSEGLSVPRASSTVGDPTLLAGLMVLALPIGLTLAVVTRGWKRVLAIVADVLLVAALGFTFTRGAWLGAVVGLVVLALEPRFRAVLIALALALAILAPGAVVDRLSTSTNFGRAEISHRFDYYEAALLIAQERPVFGVGLDNFKYAFAKLPVPQTAQRRPPHSHNIALVLLSETGLAGVLSFGMLIAGMLMLLMRRRSADPSVERRLWRLAIAASLIGSLAHQMTDSFLLEPTVNAMLWIFAGLAVLFGAGLIDAGGTAPASPASPGVAA